MKEIVGVATLGAEDPHSELGIVDLDQILGNMALVEDRMASEAIGGQALQALGHWLLRGVLQAHMTVCGHQGVQATDTSMIQPLHIEVVEGAPGFGDLVGEAVDYFPILQNFMVHSPQQEMVILCQMEAPMTILDGGIMTLEAHTHRISGGKFRLISSQHLNRI